MSCGLKSSRIGRTACADDVQEAFFGGMGRQRDVEGVAHGIRPAQFAGKPAAGVEGPAVLMQGDEQGVGVVPVDILGAVAVMAVRVDDGHPVHAVFAPQELDHDGLDVDVAEAARTVGDAHGMMSRWPHQGEALVDLSLQHRHADGFGPAGADEMGFGGDAPGVRNAEMDALDVGQSHGVRLELDDPLDVEQALLEDLVLGVEQPLLPFGMVRTDGPVVGRKENQSDLILRSQHRVWFLKNPKHEILNPKQAQNSNFRIS